MAAPLSSPRRLEGVRVLVTRRSDRARGLVAALDAEGAAPIVVPATVTVDLASADEIAAAIDAASDVVVTSANAARRLLNLSGKTVWAVGESTAAALPAGSHVRVPDVTSGAALAAAAIAGGHAGRRFALIEALDPTGDVARALAAAGADFSAVAAYRTDPAPGLADALSHALRQGFDWATFMSGSAARAIRSVHPAPFGPLRVACIGATTAAAAAAAGFHVDVVAEPPTVAALVEALAAAHRATRSDVESLG